MRLFNSSNATVPPLLPLPSNGTNTTNTTGRSNSTTNSTSNTNKTTPLSPPVPRLDISKDGNISLMISAAEPCYLTLINNNKQTDLSWTITGMNVSADIMRLSFPFNTTKQQKVNNFTMPTENDIVFVYIGATQNKDSSALISWVTPKQPVAPVNPEQPGTDAASYI